MKPSHMGVKGGYLTRFSDSRIIRLLKVHDLTLRTRIKRLARKTICFSKTIQMHDIVLGLFVNRYAFGRAV
jgi:insertion element IS1 protein InsB